MGAHAVAKSILAWPWVFPGGTAEKQLALCVEATKTMCVEGKGTLFILEMATRYGSGMGFRQGL